MQRLKQIASTTILAWMLAACGSQAAPTPTISVSDIQTLAVAAFASGLTETAQAMPTPTFTDTPAPTNTVAPLNTFQPFNLSGTPLAGQVSPTASCYGLLYIKDVTIPDNTKIDAGKKFTKTWLVQNSGGCAWQSGFKFIAFSGDPMGGSTLFLSQVVNVGDQFQLSVPMTAPNQTGTVTGWWRMADTNGTFFGNPLSVVIEVVNKATETPADTATPTP